MKEFLRIMAIGESEEKSRSMYCLLSMLFLLGINKSFSRVFIGKGIFGWEVQVEKFNEDTIS